MFITLEGPDGAGKTTFADHVEALFPECERLHHGVPTRHPLEELELDIDWYRPGGEKHLLTDRWYWSQYVYGPIYRNFNDYPGALAVHRHVELYCRSRGNLIVLMTLDPNAAHHRATERGEESSAPKDRGFTDQLHAVCAGYEQLFARSSVGTLRVDTGYVGVEAYPRLAQHVIEEAFRAQWNVAELPPQYIGGPSPQALLVGDRRPPGRQSTEHVTPFAPYPDSSGRYLLAALPDPWWQQVGIVNAHDFDEPEKLHTLWDKLGRPPMAALGSEADATLTSLALPHGVAPHPQYWRRFHYWKPELYGTLLQSAALDRERVTSWPIDRPLSPEDA